MKTLYKNLWIFVIVLVATSVFNEAKGQELVVIVNNDNPVVEMRQIEAKLYYLRKIKKVWPEMDANIRPASLSPGVSIHEAFLKKVLKMSGPEVNAYFKQRQFANAEQVPPSFQSEQQMLDYVKETPGAIGYVSKEFYERIKGQVKGVLTL